VVRGDRQLKIFKYAARLAGLRGYRRSLRAVAEQAVSGLPLAQCHGSAASLRRAGDAAGARSSLMLPLHGTGAEVSPIAAVPWAVTLWRDQPERVLVAATAHVHRWVVRKGVSKEGHVAAFAQRGEGAQAAAFDRRHRALQPLFAQLRARGLEISVISGVGYPTPVFTLEGVEALALALSRVVESDDAAGVSKSERARRVLLDATRAYPCFRPHADAHYYPQEGCTVAVQMRPPGGEGGVPEHAGADEEVEEEEEEEGEEEDEDEDEDGPAAFGETEGGDGGGGGTRMQAALGSVAASLATLEAWDPSFAPPATGPITFGRARGLGLGGLRAPPGGLQHEEHVGPPPASGGRSGWVLDTACQLPTPDGRMLLHMRPPPPGGEPLGRLPRLCSRRRRRSITWRLPDGLRVRFSVRSELSFVIWAYPAQLAAQLPAEPLHPDYLSPAALLARSRVLTSADVVGDALQGAWGGRPFEAVQLDASTIALWPAKPRTEPRPAVVPLPAWLSAPRELALDADGLPPRVQLRRSPASAEAEGMAASERAAHLIGAADEGAGAARQRTDEEAARAAGGEEGMEVTPSTAAAAAAAGAASERPKRKPKRKKTAAALTADEARAAAAAEGLELVPSSNATGYRGVRRQNGKYHSRGRTREEGKVSFFGSFATAEEASLSFQRNKKERGQCVDGM